MESFLESNIDVIKAKVPDESRRDLDMATLAKLLPWSNDAVQGYAVFTYNPFLDHSFVKYLLVHLQHCFSPDMHCLVGGMHSLADGFFSDNVLNTDDLVKHAQAFKFSYYSVPSRPNDDWVKVSCYAKSDQSIPDNTYTARVSLLNCNSFNLETIFRVFLFARDCTHQRRKNFFFLN